MSFNPVAKFFDQNRQQDDVYVFEFTGIELWILQDIRTAFVELTGAYTARSRRQAWRSIRKFMDHLILSGSGKDPKGMLESFAQHLSRNELMSKTNGSHYNFIRRMVKWLALNDFSPVWKSQTYAYYNFRREDFSVRTNTLSGKELSRVVAACKKEIVRVRENLEVRWLIEGNKSVSGSPLNEHELDSLHKLIALEGSGVWSKRQVLDSGQSNSSRLALRKLEPYRELTIRTFLPIFLLLMIETAANPFALMEIKMTCIESHPTDPSMGIISWDKPRARKEQRVAFLIKGQYSISELVSLSLRATNHLRTIVIDGDKDILFITRLGATSGRISVQGLHNALHEFRREHNFPKFTFSDIRKAVAGVVNEAFRSPKVVADFLQHSDLSTVGLYLRSPPNAQKSFERVSEFQGKMLEMIAFESSGAELATTVLGLECTSPKGGDMQGSKPGHQCLEFTKCAGCKNAIVVTDEPIYVARLIRAKLHLENMQRESYFNTEYMVRFNAVYQSALDIITFHILPKISKAVIKQAENIVPKLPALPRFF